MHPRIDMHCHVVGHGDDVTGEDDIYFNPHDNNHWLTRILYSMVEKDIIKMGGEEGHVEDGHLTCREYLDFLAARLRASEEIDAVVLLGLDAVFNPDGSMDKVRTDVYVSSRFLADQVDRLNGTMQEKRFLLGASVHPDRPDWEEQLSEAIARGAVLIKLIPSTQHIDLDARDGDPYRYERYFRMLADNGVPLLCHVGPEYSYPEGIRNAELDDYNILDAPLACGVTVIAAHCASPVFPVIDRDTIDEFAGYMEKANNRHAKNTGYGMLYGDTSAFTLTSRLPFIRHLRERFPPEWLLNGSDFPLPIDGWVHNPLFSSSISFSEHLEIRRTTNPFDKDVRVKRAHGFSDSILTNPGTVLRIPTA